MNERFALGAANNRLRIQHYKPNVGMKALAPSKIFGDSARCEVHQGIRAPPGLEAQQPANREELAPRDYMAPKKEPPREEWADAKRFL